MSGTSDQKMPIDDSDSSFYTDDNEFCVQRNGHRICVNPTRIFTSAFESMIDMFGKYYVLYQYFQDEESEKYFAMLGESEWNFWFNHIITQLRRLQTSPDWKQNGELDKIDDAMLWICSVTLLKTSEYSLFRVPTQFFHALASCIDTLAPRLPHSDFIVNVVDICTILVNNQSSVLKMIEKSGLLVQILRCSTKSLNRTTSIYRLYTLLSSDFNFIEKQFKPGQPCDDIVRKILVGKEGHSNPDPKVLNFLQTISQLADKIQAVLLDDPNIGKRSLAVCMFCNTTKSKHSMKLCSQCRTTFYCSKECQRNDWKTHKPHCQPSSFSRANSDIFHKIVDRFLIDHHDAIVLKVHETGYKLEELVLELDFAPDEFGVAPALSDPPQFEVLSVKNAHKYLQKKYPNLLLTLERLKARSLENHLNEIHLPCFCNSNEVITLKGWTLYAKKG